MAHPPPWQQDAWVARQSAGPGLSRPAQRRASLDIRIAIILIAGCARVVWAGAVFYWFFRQFPVRRQPWQSVAKPHNSLMTLTELKYIVAVAREKHFGKGAEACHVSQPTLSVVIKKREEELRSSCLSATPMKSPSRC
jgi:hypothetical protein